MNDDLQRLIRLQELDTAADAARKRVAEEPDRQRVFEERLEAARQAVASAKGRLAASQTARREVEKEVAVHQGRLSKFRDQAMAVKTNQEYHAIQHEISHAQGQIKMLEDRILESMLESDELTSAVKQAEAALTAEQKTIDSDRKALASELSALTASLDTIASERAAIVAKLDPRVLATFELVKSRRNGIGISLARDGICTICHMRLRPQVFNTVLRNEEILQCENCNRILYFVPAPAPAANNSSPAS